MKRGRILGIVDSSRLYRVLFTLMVVFTAVAVKAQDNGGETDPYADPYATPDTTVYEEDPYAIDSMYSTEDNPVEPAEKPYVRVVLPLDTITNLVTYTEIVEQDDEGSSEDSLYARTLRWVQAKFGKKAAKSVIVEEVKLKKIVVRGFFDLYMTPNKWVSSKNGIIRFTLTVRYQPGRYKYVINNLVHEMPPTATNPKPTITYFEYYTTCTVNIKGNDKVLLAADREIAKMTANLKKGLKTPIIIDEDDW